MKEKINNKKKKNILRWSKEKKRNIIRRSTNIVRNNDIRE
jgi:hypothetical protein